MTVDQLVILIVGGIALLIAIVHSRSIYRQRDRLKSRLTDLKKERDEAVLLAEQAGEDIREAAAQVGAANEARAQVEYDRDHQKRRADEQFHLIEDTVQERDGIWQMYRASVLGAGNAQDLLFKELERMARFIAIRAKEHDFKPLEPSQQMRKVLASFGAQHRNEEAARAGALEAKRELKDAVERRMDSAVKS